MSPAPRKDTEEFKIKFLETYRKLNCQLQTTCRALKIAPNTIRNWRREKVVKDGVEIVNPFDRTMKELQDEMNEKVEGNLLNSALDENRPNTVAQIFYLKNNWKDKYGENQQIEVTPSPLWFDNKQTKQIEE